MSARDASAPAVSLVVAAFNMARELPRTIRSLSPLMQRDVETLPYEVIVVDNGSTPPVDEAALRVWGANVRVLRVPDPTPSPARAMNLGLAAARGALIGGLIDGARMASPGLVSLAHRASGLASRCLVASPGFHLGPKVQMESVPEGYDRAQEDALLAGSGWLEDGYRLFSVAVLAGSSQRGWFGPINESNALFMRADLWAELGGFDEAFVTPGGGLVNLDLFSRAVAAPGVEVVTLLGEGTFHQVHGGAATSGAPEAMARFLAEYEALRGGPFQPPAYDTLQFGRLHPQVLTSIAECARRAAECAPDG